MSCEVCGSEKDVKRGAYTMRGRIFVADCCKKCRIEPVEKILEFDVASRGWDRDKMEALVRDVRKMIENS